MGILLFVSLLVVAALALGTIFTVLGFVLGGLFWLVTLPFRILFKLAAALLGGVVGLLFTPVLMLIAIVAIVGAFIAAVIALLAPLLPLALLGLAGWGIYRLSTRRSAASF